MLNVEGYKARRACAGLAKFLIAENSIFLNFIMQVERKPETENPER